MARHYFVTALDSSVVALQLCSNYCRAGLCCVHRQKGRHMYVLEAAIDWELCGALMGSHQVKFDFTCLGFMPRGIRHWGSRCQSIGYQDMQQLLGKCGPDYIPQPFMHG